MPLRTRRKVRCKAATCDDSGERVNVEWTSDLANMLKLERTYRDLGVAVRASPLCQSEVHRMN